jgi:hypothetical protein
VRAHYPTILRLVLCAAVAGCSDPAGSTTASDVDAASQAQPAPSYQPGAIVDKNVVFLTFIGGGPPTNLAAAIALEGAIEPFCTDPETGVFSPQRGIQVITPGGRIPSHVVSRDAFVQVVEYSVGIVTDPCQLVGAPLVATGRVFFSHVLHQSAESGQLVVHVVAHGIVDLVEGGQARLHARANVVIRPDGTLVIDQEPVTLTPL